MPTARHGWARPPLWASLAWWPEARARRVVLDGARGTHTRALMLDRAHAGTTKPSRWAAIANRLSRVWTVRPCACPSAQSSAAPS
jgi:hypothetical protein